MLLLLLLLLSTDIVNLDITLYHDGHHGDLNETVFVGAVDEKSRKLVEAAHTCMTKAIEQVKPGMTKGL